MRSSVACGIAGVVLSCASLAATCAWAAPTRDQPTAPAIFKGGHLDPDVSVTHAASAMKLLAARAVARNDFGSVDRFVTRALGLPQRLDAYQIDARAKADVHLCNVARDGRVVLTSRIDDVAYYFLLDPDGRPTAAAVRYPLQPHTPVAIDSVHAQLDKILSFWLEWTDRNNPAQ